jgi:predicted DNA-binding transcriptional regulator AlpA
MATTIQPTMSEGQLISARQVCDRVGISRVTLWHLMNTENFPRPLRLAPESPKSRLRFRLEEIVTWVVRQQELSVEAAEAGAGSLHLSR